MSVAMENSGKHTAGGVTENVANGAVKGATGVAKNASTRSRRAERRRQRALKRAANAAPEQPKSMRASAGIRALTICIMVLALIYFLFPIYWVLISSTKTPGEMVSSSGLWFAVPLDQLGDSIARNYQELLNQTRGYFWQWVGNSVLYSTVAATIGTITSVMAGYATAKFRFRGKGVAIGIVMAALLMPAALMTIPQYAIFQSVGLDNTMASMIIPCCVSPFGFFLGRVYAETSVPTELLEAARIDGASESRIFFTIVLRILAPALVTIFLFMFVATWNNFLLPLMMISSDSLKPITLGLYGMVSLATFNERGVLMMGALFGVIPLILIFVFLQRYWQAGLAAGSVKQ